MRLAKCCVLLHYYGFQLSYHRKFYILLAGSRKMTLKSGIRAVLANTTLNANTSV